MPSAGTYIFAGTESSGIFRSTNTGTTWSAANVGLTNTTIASLTAVGSNLFAGTLGGGVFGKNARGEGSGYLGLGEFYAGCAIRTMANGNSVLVSFFDDTREHESVFERVISSFKISSR